MWPFRSRAERALRRKARSARRRVTEAKGVLQQLKDSGAPRRTWEIELAARWKEWDDAEDARIRGELVASLKKIHPELSPAALELLANRVGRKS